jgi:hypothetical protein
VRFLVFAHADLVSPTPRVEGAQKVSPCGSAVRTATPHVYTAGSQLTVQWEETIDHPGHYRIAFAPADDMGFDANVLADDLTDMQGGTLPHMYSTTVTLPTTPCDSCTLQLIQVMTESNPPSYYYSCADLQLVAQDEPPKEAELPAMCSIHLAGRAGQGILVMSGIMLAVLTLLTRKRRRR